MREDTRRETARCDTLYHGLRPNTAVANRLLRLPESGVTQETAGDRHAWTRRGQAILAGQPAASATGKYCHHAILILIIIFNYHKRDPWLPSTPGKRTAANRGRAAHHWRGDAARAPDTQPGRPDTAKPYSASHTSKNPPTPVAAGPTTPAAFFMPRIRADRRGTIPVGPPGPTLRSAVTRGVAERHRDRPDALCRKGPWRARSAAGLAKTAQDRPGLGPRQNPCA